MNNKEILIIKANGDKVPFDKDKLKKSLYNAGVQVEIATQIVSDITAWIAPNMTTQEIYKKAFSLLHEVKDSSLSRYLLKEALLEIGPTGYPFEKFMGYIFEKQGFEVKVGVEIEGAAVIHEMDVVATKGKVQHLVECKYHQDQGKQSGVQVPLYVRARINDIIEKRKENKSFAEFEFIGWVVTNTRFSFDAIKYAEHSGLKLMSWDYPKGSSLKETIEKLKIYPVTVLHHLTKAEKEKILSRGIVTCSELLNNKKLLTELNIDKERYQELLTDLNALS